MRSRTPHRALAQRLKAKGPVPQDFEFAEGTGRHRIWGTAFISRGGLAVSLVGGDVPHIGAVAISIPRPGLANPRERSATTSVFTMLGHKEDELARPVAAGLAQALGRTTVVVAGVHIDRARTADIAKVFENAGRAVEAIIAKLKATRREAGGATGMSGSPLRRGGRPDARGLRRRTKIPSPPLRARGKG